MRLKLNPRYIQLAAFLLLVVWGCAGTSSVPHAIIRIKGSDTMYRLTGIWAEEYMKLHPRLSLYTEGGGTATGVKALIEGKTDICAASRTLTSDEASLLARKYQALGWKILVAKDALSVYVHPQNPVQDLSLKQLKEIFTGKIINWSQLGGNDADIRVLIRSPNSGTYLYLKEHILDGEPYRKDARTMPTTSAIVETILNNPDAIGYGGIAYGPQLVHCRINSIPPTIEAIRYDLYPITRYLYLYTINKPEGNVKSFINWVLSPEGQKLVEKVGYVPLWDFDR